MGAVLLLALFGSCTLTAQDLAFVPNRGQFAPSVSFEARGSNYAISLAGTETTLRVGSGSAIMKFSRGKSGVPEALDPQPGHSNYLIGNDPSQWKTDVPHFSRVRYSGIYPGIDVVYYGNQRQLEYDFVVSPQADPGRIGIEFEHANRLEVAPDGDLTVGIAQSELRLLKPVVYQEIGGVRRQVAGSYVLRGRNRVGFRISGYDHRFPLVIDPILAYSTYLGGTADEIAYAVTTDSNNNSYVTGYTSSANFPVAGAYQGTNLGATSNAFVTKYSSTGALLYSTYLGGNGQDVAYGIAVDSLGDTYVTGSTTSTNFPRQNAYSANLTGSTNAFVTELNALGNGLMYSTYLGGSGTDIGYGIALDGSGDATITGSTTSANFPHFPVLPYQNTNQGGASDAFVTRLSTTGTALVYSTYLGGSGTDLGYAVALDSAGNAYVTGYTNSGNFPNTNNISPVAQAALAGDYDAFVTAVSTTGTNLLYSTFLGGNNEDYGVGIAVDANGDAWIAGTTASANYPVTGGVLQGTFGGGYDAFVTELTPSGTRAYSTFLGGSGDDFGLAIAVDATGTAYVTGDTASTNFPTTFNSLQSTVKGSFNIFVSQINPTGTALDFSTYLGGTGYETGYGIAVDASGAAWVAGYTASTDFPVTNPATQANSGGGTDVFLVKLLGLAPQTINFALNLNKTFGDPPFSLPAATASSGLPVTFSSGTPLVCTVSGSNVTIVGGGTCTIVANQGGDATFDSAPPISQSVTINPEGQTISFTPPSSETFGTAPFPITATATPSGLNVSFASTTQAVCTVSGATVTIVAVSTGTCTISATQVGNANYAAAPANNLNITVNKEPQTITFNNPPASVNYPTSFTLTATASSNLNVAYTSNTLAFCTVNQNTGVVTLVLPASLPGTCTIAANIAANQPASANYVPVTSNNTQSITINKEPQTITFAQINNIKVNAGPVVIPQPTASSNLVPVSLNSLTTPTICTITGLTITLLLPGTCTIQAMQAGNAIFAAVTPNVNQSFTVNTANSTNQMITFGAINPINFTTTPFNLTASSTSGLAVTFASNSPNVCTVSGVAVTLAGVGSCSITATQAGGMMGNTLYGVATPMTRSFTVNQGTNAINFPNPGSVSMPGLFTLAATAASGLTVTFASNTQAVCKVNGTTLTLVTTGSCTVTANQAGNTNYAAATAVMDTFTIVAAAPSGGGGGGGGVGGGGGGSSAGTLTADPETVTFNMASGGAPTTQTVSLTYSNALAGAPNFTTVVQTNDTPWLTVSPSSGAMVQTPGSSIPHISTVTLTIQADPTGLVTGSIHTATITYIANLTSADTTSVTLNVTNSTKLTVAPQSLNFNYTLGSSNTPAAQSIAVSSSPAGAKVTATPSSTGNWLSATAGGTSLSNTTPGSVSVSVDVTKLSTAGTFTGSVTIAGGASNISVPVTITVAGSSPAVLSVSPLMESFSLAQGGSAVSSQVTVSNAGSGTLNFTAQASSTPAWLMLANSSGSATSSTPAALGFTIDPTGLSPGLYTGQITVSDTASANQSTVTVVLTVTQAAESIQLSQTGLAFSGVTGGAQPPGQAFTVANSGAGTLNWSAQASTLSGGSWLLLSAGGGTSASGQAGIPVVVSVDPTGLSPGQYYGSVNVTATGATNSPQTVSVVLTVSPAQTSPGETISTGGVILAGAAGGTTPLQQIVNVFNPSSAAVTYTSTTSMANGTGWLSVTPPSGSVSPGTNGIPVVVNLSGLAAGLYSGSVSLAFGDGSSATIQVLALATGGATGSAVTGKAGNKPRPLALTPCAGGKPGFLIPILQQPVNQSTVAVAAPQTVEVEIIDSCGNPVTTAAGGTVQVTFSGAGSKNDPGLSLQDIGGGIWEATWAPVNPANQVTLQVEASEAGITLNPTLNVGNSVTVTVQGATTTTAPQPTGVANAASAALATPGVVAPGSYVAIYGTGLAGSGNPSATSLPLPTTLNGTQLLLGGIPMPLLYAGPTQVNAIVPQAIAPNATYPLVVVTGG
ncbi:MAG TPA: SBBP repeat-containing protein, partial [Bryobacteraceae bacterium]